MGIIDDELDIYGNRSWKVTTPPASEPVTADEVKTFCRIDGSDEDTLIESFITTVRDAAEKYMHRALIEQTITLVMDFWPNGSIIKLPSPPLISIVGIYTTDEDDVDTEYNSDYYFVDIISEPGKLLIKQGYTEPINTERDYSGYKIVYKSGYGDSSDDVPESIKLAIKLWVSAIYETRLFDPKNPPIEVKNILDLYTVHKI